MHVRLGIIMINQICRSLFLSISRHTRRVDGTALHFPFFMKIIDNTNDINNVFQSININLNTSGCSIWGYDSLAIGYPNGLTKF